MAKLVYAQISDSNGMQQWGAALLEYNNEVPHFTPVTDWPFFGEIRSFDVGVFYQQLTVNGITYQRILFIDYSFQCNLGFSYYDLGELVPYSAIDPSTGLICNLASVETFGLHVQNAKYQNPLYKAFFAQYLYPEAVTLTPNIIYVTPLPVQPVTVPAPRFMFGRRKWHSNNFNNRPLSDTNVVAAQNAATATSKVIEQTTPAVVNIQEAPPQTPRALEPSPPIVATVIQEKDEREALDVVAVSEQPAIVTAPETDAKANHDSPDQEIIIEQPQLDGLEEDEEEAVVVIEDQQLAAEMPDVSELGVNTSKKKRKKKKKSSAISNPTNAAIPTVKDQPAAIIKPEESIPKLKQLVLNQWRAKSNSLRSNIDMLTATTKHYISNREFTRRQAFLMCIVCIGYFVASFNNLNLVEINKDKRKMLEYNFMAFVIESLLLSLTVEYVARKFNPTPKLK